MCDEYILTIHSKTNDILVSKIYESTTYILDAKTLHWLIRRVLNGDSGNLTIHRWENFVRLERADDA